MRQPTTPVRVAELMACLSVATDLGMGQPADYAMTTCVVAMRLGDALGFDTPTLHDVYYETLLRYVGCNADTYWFASLFGDELAFTAEHAEIDFEDMPALVDLVRCSIRRAAAGTQVLGVEQAIVRALGELLGGPYAGPCCAIADRRDTMHKNAEIVRRAYQAFNTADMKTLTEVFDEHASWDTPGRGSLAGDREGSEVVFTQFDRYLQETGGTFQADLQHVLAYDNGRVVAVHHNTAARKGKRQDVDCCIVFELEDGRCIDGRECFYNLHAWDKFWS